MTNKVALGDSRGLVSQGIKIGNMVFIAGQLGLNDKGQLVSGGVAGETKQALERIKAIIEEAGGSLPDIVKVNIYIKDMEDISIVNEIYSTFFVEYPRPARATVAVKDLAMKALIEIEAIAVIK